MNRKHYAFFLKKNRKKPNPIAKDLKFFTPQGIEDKTKYRRKEKHVQTRSFWESN